MGGAVWSPRCALATISLLTPRFFCVGGDGASFFRRENSVTYYEAVTDST